MTTIQACLEVSTGHLSSDERDRLFAGDAVHQFVGPLSVYRDVESATACCLLADEEGQRWRAEWPTLAAIVDRSQRYGATMLLIGADVDTVTGLAEHD